MYTRVRCTGKSLTLLMVIYFAYYTDSQKIANTQLLKLRSAWNPLNKAPRSYPHVSVQLTVRHRGQKYNFSLLDTAFDGQNEKNKNIQS